MIDFNSLLTWDYWLAPQPIDFNNVIPVTILFAFLLVLGFIGRRLLRTDLKNKLIKKFLKGVPAGLYTFGFTGLILTFFRYQYVRYLSMRLWFLLLFVAFLAWIGFHIFKFRVLYPKVECEYKDAIDADRYRPHAKNKGNKKKRR